MTQIIFSLFLLVPSIHAKKTADQVKKVEVKKEAADKEITGKATIKVKGMVCAFCAQGIEKKFGKVDSVQKTKVDLDKMTVNLEVKKGEALKESAVKKIIVDSGFAYGGILEK